MSSVFLIGAEIWKLIEDEGEANKGYAEFLACYEDVLDPKTLEEIKEIMSEETKHVNILMKIAEDYTSIKAEE